MNRLPLDTLTVSLLNFSEYSFVRLLYDFPLELRLTLINDRHHTLFPEEEVDFETLPQYVQHITTYHLLIAPGSQHFKSKTWCYRRAAQLGEVGAMSTFSAGTNPLYGLIWAAHVGSMELVNHYLNSPSLSPESVIAYASMGTWDPIYEAAIMAIEAGQQDIVTRLMEYFISVVVGNNAYLDRLRNIHDRVMRLIVEAIINGINIQPLWPSIRRWYRWYEEHDRYPIEEADLDEMVDGFIEQLRIAADIVSSARDSPFPLEADIMNIILPLVAEYGRLEVWSRLVGRRGPDQLEADSPVDAITVITMALHYNQLDLLRGLIELNDEWFYPIVHTREDLWREGLVKLRKSVLTTYEQELTTPETIIFLEEMDADYRPLLFDAIMIGEVELIKRLEASIVSNRIPDPMTWAAIHGHLDLATYFRQELGAASLEEIEYTKQRVYGQAIYLADSPAVLAEVMRING